jgi:hypothetical protein
MTITALPTPPSTNDPANFAAKADALLAALPKFVSEANAVAVAMNLNSTTDTSATSNAIGIGAKTFTVTGGKSFQPGMYLVIADTAAPSTNSMFGQITSYSGTSLVMNIISILGSGTKTAWTISQSAPNYNPNNNIGARLNKLANGCCQVAQRNNLTISLTTARLIGQVDACALWASGGAVSAGTLTQLATGALAGGTGYAARAAGVTLTGAGVISFATRMEARDAKKFKNQTCSFQIAVDHDVGSSVNYTIIAKKVTTTDDVFSALTTISTGSPIAVATATGTLLTFQSIAMGDCSHGIEFEVQAACGAITTKNFNFTEFAVDIGSVCPTFCGNPYEVDLAMCQRYLPTWKADASFSILGPAYASSTTLAMCMVPFNVQTRQNPTGILSSAANMFVFQAVATFTPSAISFNPGTTSTSWAGNIGFTIAGATAGQAGQGTANSSSAYLIFTGAELF